MFARVCDRFLSCHPGLGASLSVGVHLRPGDTVWLSPSTSHVAMNVVVPWPLHIRGGGSRPEETVVSSPRGAETVLDFRYCSTLA